MKVTRADARHVHRKCTSGAAHSRCNSSAAPHHLPFFSFYFPACPAGQATEKNQKKRKLLAPESFRDSQARRGYTLLCIRHAPLLLTSCAELGGQQETTSIKESNLTLDFNYAFARAK